MRFAVRSSYWRGMDRASWHDWYAWRPVRINGREIAWLEMVQRRVEYGIGGATFYREKQNENQ